MSREVFRHEELKSKIEVGRIRDWFICMLIFCNLIYLVADDMLLIVNVESEGPYAPERLLIEATSIMREKIAAVRKSANALVAQMDLDVNIDVEMAG